MRSSSSATRVIDESHGSPRTAVRRSVLVAVGSILALLGAMVAIGSVPSSAATSSGTTVSVQPAQPVVFGAGTQKADGYTSPYGLACPADGACVVGGDYRNVDDRPTWFASSQVGANWSDGEALPVPGTVVDPLGSAVAPFGLACDSAGSCVAAGQVSSADGRSAAIATMESGVWTRSVAVTFPTARLVPALDEAGGSDCVKPGRCLSVVTSQSQSNRAEAFVVPTIDDVPQIAVPLGAPTGPLVPASVETFARSVSCAAEGECVVAGSFLSVDGAMVGVAWVQHGGVWGDAQIGAFPDGQLAAPVATQLVSMCTRGDRCSVLAAAGVMVDSRQVQRLYIAPVVDGVMGAMVPVVMDPALATMENVQGGFVCMIDRCIVFVSAILTDGTWIPSTFEIVDGAVGTMVPLPTTTPPAAVGDVAANDVACTSARNCVGVGYAVDHSVTPNVTRPVYWTMVDGIWSAPALTAIVESANGKPNSLGAQMWGVECVVGGTTCVATGTYEGADRIDVESTPTGIGDGTKSSLRPAISSFAVEDPGVGGSGVPPSRTGVHAMTMQVTFIPPAPPAPPRFTG